uniref:Uncharacterized protein n=1 Tax=Ditylenchus dipsaci TaxID=166011 RepID=A0A915E7Y7_9BILA
MIFPIDALTSRQILTEDTQERIWFELTDQESVLDLPVEELQNLMTAASFCMVREKLKPKITMALEICLVWRTITPEEEKEQIRKDTSLQNPTTKLHAPSIGRRDSSLIGNRSAFDMEMSTMMAEMDRLTRAFTGYVPALLSSFTAPLPIYDPFFDELKSPLIRDESDGKNLRLRYDVPTSTSQRK